MNKLWLDVETTGLDTNYNGIIQLACIYGKDTFEMKIKPFDGCFYDKKAKEIHGKSKKVIQGYIPEKDAILKFVLWLQKHQIGREQFSIAGYNSRFDQDFITAWFKRHDVNFWVYFNYYDVDVFALVKILDLGSSNKKLATLCADFDIKLNAHDAMSDIKATKKLYKKIMKGI